MMRSWCKFLPVAFVRWYSVKNCERYQVFDGTLVVNPLPGVIFEVNK